MKVDIHMYLSKLGAIPKLLDFIRVNDETEQLIVIGKTLLYIWMFVRYISTGNITDHIQMKLLQSNAYNCIVL